MKSWIIALAITLDFLASGCAYLTNRTHDLADVVTVSVEDHKFACMARPLVFLIGASVASGKGVGLRLGHLGQYDYTENASGIPLVLASVFNDDSCYKPRTDPRNKGFDYLCESRDFNRGESDLPATQAFLLEFNIGIYYGVRLGFNFLEAIDFILGWTTLDIMDDDRAGGNKNRNPNGD